MGFTGLTKVICTALILSAICSIPVCATPTNGEEETAIIDTETATKLAMLASYEANYGMAIKMYMHKHAITDRVLVDVYPLSSLDGTEEYYAITLYRGKDEPEDIAVLRERMMTWVNPTVALTKLLENGNYSRTRPDDGILPNFFIEPPAVYHDYYQCVVPASTSQGFLTEFVAGISYYNHLGEIALLILAADQEVNREDVTLIRATPGLNFLCEVKGERFIVNMLEFYPWHYIQMIRGDAAVEEYIESYESETEADIRDEHKPPSRAELAAREDKISVLLDYLGELEERSAFGPGPSLTSEAASEFLQEKGVNTLVNESSKFKVAFDGTELLDENDDE